MENKKELNGNTLPTNQVRKTIDINANINRSVTKEIEKMDLKNEFDFDEFSNWLVDYKEIDESKYKVFLVYLSIFIKNKSIPVAAKWSSMVDGKNIKNKNKLNSRIVDNKEQMTYLLKLKMIKFNKKTSSGGKSFDLIIDKKDSEKILQYAIGKVEPVRNITIEGKKFNRDRVLEYIFSEAFFNDFKLILSFWFELDKISIEEFKNHNLKINNLRRYVSSVKETLPYLSRVGFSKNIKKMDNEINNDIGISLSDMLLLAIPKSLLDKGDENNISKLINILKK